MATYHCPECHHGELSYYTDKDDPGFLYELWVGWLALCGKLEVKCDTCGHEMVVL